MYPTKLTVINKNDNQTYTVYDIAYDKVAYPHFLIYKDGQWLRLSAKYFRPQTTEDIINELTNMDKLELKFNRV